MLKIGEKSPNFNLQRDGQGALGLNDYKGRILVIYFYPKDDTAGCTKEAIDFTQNLVNFNAADASVIGVSKDSVTKHDKFIAKHSLEIPLLSDITGQICEDFGVWKEKSMYGKTYMGIERTTFLIDGDGIIREIWRKVRVKGHVDAVLNAVLAL
ncbi:MAG: thioredoxin-dependent thiol peroxidase [Amylibacter sp.]